MQRVTSTVLARVARTVVAHGMVVPGTRVLVAVSGGPDSVGLLCILDALRRKLEIDLVAAHVNHHLRGDDSVADEQVAARSAERLGVPFKRADLSLRAGGNLESRARELRYQALHRLAHEADCARIATGHTRDDQAETVLLRLIRGSGVGGLSGIEARRRDGVIRPLLDCRCREVEAFVRAAGHEYRLDASNRDERFLRARVRHTVLPLLAQLNPAIVDSLVRLSSLGAAEKKIVEAWATQQLGQMQQERVLDLRPLRSFVPELRSHLLRAWLLGLGLNPIVLTARHVDAVTRLASGNRSSGQVTLRDAVIVRRYDRLFRAEQRASTPAEPYVLTPGTVAEVNGWRIEAESVAPRRTSATEPDLWSAMCDATALADSLVVRSPRVGERVRPFGLRGRHRKLSDVFIDRKVPAAERKAYPVVSYGEEILWVPGVIRSELLRVGERTTAVLQLRAERCTRAVT